jgi:TolB-like protein
MTGRQGELLMSRGAQREDSRHHGIACRATLFGAFHLRQADGSEIAISNRRARAVLAMLCVEPNGPIERAYLSKVLWPGRFEAHAKASLRQCLLDLGKLLAPCGTNMLVMTRTTVAIYPSALQTELDGLEECLEHDDYRTAANGLLTIGTRPLLDQMEFGDEFNQWLARARAASESRLRVAIEKAIAGLEPNNDLDLRSKLETLWSARNLGLPPPLPATVPDDKTRIAVLPFGSVGVPNAQQYFVDGVVDELITALGQVPQLLVAGRTSSFHFRDSDQSHSAIADALRVSHLLEGSVQRQGDRIRIHVHMIAGDTGFELWGGRFDGTLDTIFALQEDVAQAVTAAIGKALAISMAPPLVRGLTSSKAAYDLYLQGRALNARLFGDGVLTRAEELLEQAIALDPNFAEAWVLLADVHQRKGIYLAGTDLTEASATMADCVRKALAIKGDLGHAYGLLALHEFTRNNIVGSLDLAFKGFEVEPNNPAVAVRLGGLLLFCGLTKLGMHYLDKAIDQDPADGRHYMVRSAGQLNLGDIGAAIADAQRCVDLGFPSIWLGVAHAAAGNHDLAVDYYQQTRLMLNQSIPPPNGMTPMSPEMMDAYWLVAAKGVCSGRPEDREAYCRTLDFLHATMTEKEHLAITAPAVFMGYADLLFRTIGARITLQNLACLMSIWADIDPIRQIWRHPEFIPFAQRIGMAAAWDKYGWPDLLPPPTNL